MLRNDFYMTRDDGVKLFRTYSDSGMMIRQNQTDILYSEAIDVMNSGYTYTETDILIETEEPEESQTPEE